MFDPYAAQPVFHRSLPERVTWNELFRIAATADAFSRLLNQRNRDRRARGLPGFPRLTHAHNHVVRSIAATIEHDSFEEWAQSQDCWRGDMWRAHLAAPPSAFPINQVSDTFVARPPKGR